MIITDNFLETIPDLDFQDNRSYWSEPLPFPPSTVCGDLAETIGIEWWCTSLSPKDTIEDLASTGNLSLFWHRDDDCLDGHLPLGGGVLYILDGPVEGGLLLPWNIEPVHNRFVSFDVTELHAVSEVFSGVRNSLTINFWDKKILGIADRPIPWA